MCVHRRVRVCACIFNVLLRRDEWPWFGRCFCGFVCVGRCVAGEWLCFFSIVGE